MTRMYKIFRDSWCDADYLAVNLSFLPDAAEVALGQNVRVLSYRRLPGDWLPTHIGQLMALSRQLGQLVQAGIVHGDIRLYNVVFAPIDESAPTYVAHFIDFDLSRPVGSRYPVQLSPNICDGDRHPDALQFNAIMQHSHDFYSFLHLLRLFRPQSKSLRSQYLSAVASLSCDNRTFCKQVRAALRPLYNEAIELTPDALKLLDSIK